MPSLLDSFHSSTARFMFPPMAACNPIIPLPAAVYSLQILLKSSNTSSKVSNSFGYKINQELDFSRWFIIANTSFWSSGLGHMKCCPVPFTSCDLFSYKVWGCYSNDLRDTFTSNMTDGLWYEIKYPLFLKKKAGIINQECTCSKYGKPVTGSDIVCLLLITFAYTCSLYPDQARQNVRPDLDANCLALWWYAWKIFSKKLILTWSGC